MAEELRAHDAIVRTTIERHGGFVFDAGSDGMRAAFSTPADAAAAAIESQKHAAGRRHGGPYGVHGPTHR